KMVNGSKKAIEIAWLFHGTNAGAVSQIVRQGFNRSYAGRNGSVYGKGCYFARYATHSVGFAKPDAAGVMKVLMCRVAVGDFCKGNKKHVNPDPKSECSRTHFDSTVDDIRNPYFFVTYHDDQAYPEYVVTFKKKKNTKK
ncbi:MAG: hypothetical protein SGARI_001340, partial [Bacillariaceae sp.]